MKKRISLLHKNTASNRARVWLATFAALSLTLPIAGAGTGSFADAQETQVTTAGDQDESAPVEQAPDQPENSDLEGEPSPAPAASPEADHAEGVESAPTAAERDAADADSDAHLTVERADGIDTVTVSGATEWYDPGKVDRQTDDGLIGLNVKNAGGDPEVVSIVSDGQELEPENYALVTTEDGAQLLVDANALNSVPPEKIEFRIRTTQQGEYTVAERDEIPARVELEQAGHFAPHDAEAVDAPFTGNRAAPAPGAGKKWSDEIQLRADNVRYVNSDKVSGRPVLDPRPSDMAGKDIHITRMRVTYNGGTSVAIPMRGPCSVTKNDQETHNPGNCREVSKNQYGKVNSLEMDLSQDNLRVWSGEDELKFAYGAGPFLGGIGSYQLDIWGRYQQCTAPEAVVSDPAGPRALTPEEQNRGTSVYVSTSENKDAQGGNTNNQRGSTRLSLQVQGKDEFESIGTSNWIYNALAYNPKDNWLYGVSQQRPAGDNDCYPAGNLLQINPSTGEVRNLGPITANGGGDLFASAGDRDFLNAGVIYGDSLYASNSSTSGTKQMYRIPLPSGSGFTSKKPTGTKLGWEIYSEDFTILPSDPGHAWGAVSSPLFGKTGLNPGVPAGQTPPSVILERKDLQTGKSEFIELKGNQLLDPSGKKLEPTTTFGKAWTYGNGNLGIGPGGESKSSGGAQIHITDPASPNRKIEIVQTLWNVPFSFNTDAASNGVSEKSPKSDLAVRKVAAGPYVQDPEARQFYADASKNIRAEGQGRYADPNNFTFWMIDAYNPGKTISSGGTLSDVLPDGYDINTAKVFGATLSPDDTVHFTNIQSGINRVDHSLGVSWGPLEPGQRLRLLVYAGLKEGQECSPNRAEVTNNDQDSDKSNNESVADCAEKQLPKFGVGLQKIDAEDKTQVLTGAGFAIRELNGEDQSGRQLRADGDSYVSEKDLEAGKDYELVETQAPTRTDKNGEEVSYNLLPEPVRFHVISEDGAPKVEFFDGQKWSTNSPWAGIWAKPNPEQNMIYLQVADVRQGNLPKTGGEGLLPLLAAAGILLAAGGLMVCRRMV